MTSTIHRRLLVPALVVVFVITAYWIASLHPAVPSPHELVAKVGATASSIALPQKPQPLPPATIVPPTDQPIHEDKETVVSTVEGNQSQEEKPAQEDKTVQEHKETPSASHDERPTYEYKESATAESEKGDDHRMGTHYHIRPTGPVPTEVGFKDCKYPIMIHTTMDDHCTGALALYASVVRNTLTQPEALKDKTCVHFTYVDPTLKTLEEMYKWTPRPNPFTANADCKKLDSTPEYNSLVPVQWQALPVIQKPEIMTTGFPNWIAALNKVHSWAFDVYPRALYLDGDSMVLTDLDKIFDETADSFTIAGAADAFNDCNDRNRINGGMILLHPSRYLHVVMLELLNDPRTTCMSGHWDQSEQELLNCFCGFGYADRPHVMPRPEFSCTVMPAYNSILPMNYGCSDTNVKPMRSIHFVTKHKPWAIEEKNYDKRFDSKFWKCLRDHAREGDANGLKSCTIPPLEETRVMDGVV